jgi:hypothetical protein
MLRRLLNIASIVCLVLCVVLMGMWVRSYHADDTLSGRLSAEHGFSIESIPGRLILFEGTGLYTWAIATVRAEGSKTHVKPKNFGFAVYYYGMAGTSAAAPFFMLVVPYWFLTLVSGSLAMLLRLRRPLRQFSLRSLFIATTFLAVVLGMIAWLDRAWIGK